MSLVLSRTEGQALCLGEHVRMKVLSVKRNVVRVGFTAPDGIPLPKGVSKMSTGDSFNITGQIKVTVGEVRGNKARFAIDAPRHVPVDRLEIRERKNQERQQQSNH